MGGCGGGLLAFDIPEVLLDPKPLVDDDPKPLLELDPNPL